MHNTYFGCLTIAQTKSTTSKMFKHNKSLIIKFTRDTKTINNHHKKRRFFMFHLISWCVRFFFSFLFCTFVYFVFPSPFLALSLWGFFCKCLTFEISLIHMHSNFNPTPKVKSINQSFVIFFSFFCAICMNDSTAAAATTNNNDNRNSQMLPICEHNSCKCVCLYVQCMSCAYWILLSESHKE